MKRDPMQAPGGGVSRFRVLRGRSAGALAGLLTAVMLLGAPDALAGPKYHKRHEVRIKARRTKITAVKTKKSTAHARVFKPSLFAEQFRAKTQDRVAKLTDDAIGALKRLLQVTEDTDPEKPDVLFRLAEHYREKQNQYMFRARELDEKIYQAKTEGEKAQYRARQKKYEQAEKRWMLASVKMYLHIATKAIFKHYRRMDEVLFNVADMLNKAGRQDKARVFFGRLIRSYPQSKYIPDAYLSFAEFYFNDKRVEDALKLYQQVSKYPNSPIYGYAIYKQGWCWLNLKNPKKALQMFVKVIMNSGAWSNTKKSKIVLVKEAKKDSVRAYANVPGATPQRAWPFFKKIGGKYAFKMLEMLARLYYDQGKFMDSVVVYRHLIALKPRSKKLCTWQYQIVKGILSGKDKRTQVVEAKRLAAVYMAIKSRKDISKTSRLECRSNAAGVLRELATTWHREAQKTQNMDTYALAQYLYKEYIDTFPEEKDAYEMTYYYAELMYKLAADRGRADLWQKAAETYTTVVKMNPKGKYLKDAAYAAVIAWRKALDVTDEGEDTSARQKKHPRKRKCRGRRCKKVKEEIKYDPKPISEKQQKMIAAFDTYIQNVPDAPELVPIIYRKARIYYDHNHFDEAVKIFATIVNKHPSHELAIYAANLLLDALNIQKKFDELNAWVDRMLKIKVLAKGEMLVQLRKLKQGAQWQAAEKLRKEKRFKECGERFASMANEYQESDRWAEMLYNSAMCFEAAKLIGLAISIRHTLIKVKPEHKLAQKAMYMIGANYHALAWYSRAADWYERFAKKYPGEKNAPEALQNAIVFRLGAGKYDKAIEYSKLFEKNYGPRRKFAARTAAVNFSMGAIFENRQNWDAVVKHYEKYLRKWGRHGGLDRQIRAHVKIGELQWRQSCPTHTVNGACIKVKRVRSKRKVKKRRRHKKGIELRTQCGPETKMRVTVVPRNKNKARQAQNHFKKALALWRRAVAKGLKGVAKKDAARRNLDMNFAAAAARFYQGEQAFEGFLRVKFPKGLDFSPGKSKKQKKKAEKSKKAFSKYLEEKGKKLAETRAAYQDVIKMKVAHWAIAASARIGQLFQNFADALYTAPVPKPPVPKGLYSKEAKEEFIVTFTDTYCDTLEDKAAPLETKAIQGLATCLSKSTELSWYNDWSKLCEKELNQIKPAEYPLAAEIRAEPGYVSFRTDRASLVKDIK